MDQNIFEIPLIIFIVGTTASGKTKLSLELAQRYNGEIISSDSMQLYKTADILTAKATKEEQSKATHHMIDLIDITHQGFIRNQFYFEAIEIIKQIHQRGKIPIIIGGTHYYTETLLFDLDIQKPVEEQETLNNDQLQRQNQIESLKIESKQDADEIDFHYVIKKIDENMAKRLHSKDQRKIETYLRLYIATGQLPSEYVQDNDIGQLRFKNSIIFQPKIKSKELMKTYMENRIRKDMVGVEGLQEILTILYKITEENKLIDLSKENKQKPRGIYQAIGYKEFKGFYEKMLEKAKSIQSDEKQQFLTLINEDFIADNLQNNNEIKKIFNECTDRLITNTFKYAKSQIKWINNRLLNSPDVAPRIFSMEFEEYSSDIFQQKVKEPAFQIMDQIMKQKNKPIIEQLSLLITEFQQYNGQTQLGNLKLPKRIQVDKWEKFYCDLCKREVNGEHEWRIHLKSTKHKQNKKKQDKKDKKLANQNQTIEKQISQNDENNDNSNDEQIDIQDEQIDQEEQKQTDIIQI